MTSAPSSGLAIAPSPPGALGQAADPNELLGYLRALRDWTAQRKRELDALDAAALRSAHPDDLAADVTLSMTLWQSVDDRVRRLDLLWDAGRADVVTREQMSQVIWGRMAAGGGLGAQLSLSVVEASRLSDALAAQLRARLAFDPQAGDAVTRVKALRASLERLRELVKQEPGWSGQVELLAGRVDDLAVRAARGGDVDSALRSVEVDAATAERDLVVTTASKLRQARSAEAEAARLVADRARSASEAAALEHRRTRLLDLVARCVAEISPAPRYAVPDVAALGAVPADRAGVDAYLQRLDAVTRAMDLVEQRYGAPLAEREELAGLLASYRAMADRLIDEGPADPTRDAALTAAFGVAERAVTTRPCDVAAARLAVATYRELLRGRPPQHPADPSATGARA